MANRFTNRFLTRLRMTKPIIQAPMTGYVTKQMVIADSNRGGLGSLLATLLPLEATLQDGQDHVVPFPLGMAAVAALAGASLKVGFSDLAPFWAGQAVGLGKPMDAADVVQYLSAAALA